MSPPLRKLLSQGDSALSRGNSALLQGSIGRSHEAIYVGQAALYHHGFRFRENDRDDASPDCDEEGNKQNYFDYTKSCIIAG
jgi:hypothetical protein